LAAPVSGSVRASSRSRTMLTRNRETRLDMSASVPKRMIPFHTRTDGGSAGFSPQSTRCQAIDPPRDSRIPSEKPPHQAQAVTGSR